MNAMTPDIEKLALEAGIDVYHDWQSSYESETVKRSVMECLYALIRAHVLEEAAQAVETSPLESFASDPYIRQTEANRAQCAAAIRALKQP